MTSKGLILLFIFVFSPSVLARLTDEPKVVDFHTQVTKYDDEFIGVFGVDIAATSNLVISAEIDTDKYLELGVSYDWLYEKSYFNVYGQYGFDDTIDIYDLGFLYGYSLTPKMFLYWNTYYQWRNSSKTIELPEQIDYVNYRQEWKNTIGVSYTVHRYLQVGVNYNLDILTSDHGYESSTRSSYDLSLTAKLPYVQPYVKYTKGQYRVRPGRPIEDSSNVELGFYLDF